MITVRRACRPWPSAVDELGGSVLEHYQTVLHLRVRTDRNQLHGSA